MDLMITSKILETLETGVVLEVNADDLHVRAYIVVSAVDMEVVEKLIPSPSLRVARKCTSLASRLRAISPSKSSKF